MRPRARRRAVSEWRRGSNDGQARALEHLGERDQRQADERSRILGVDTCDQRDPQSLGLRAGGAVIGLLAPQIALDARIVERPKVHAAGDDSGLPAAVPPLAQSASLLQAGAL